MGDPFSFLTIGFDLSTLNLLPKKWYCFPKTALGFGPLIRYNFQSLLLIGK